MPRFYETLNPDLGFRMKLEKGLEKDKWKRPIVRKVAYKLVEKYRNGEISNLCLGNFRLGYFYLNLKTSF